MPPALIVFPGPLPQAVEGARRELRESSRKITSQVWTGDTLLVAFDDPHSRPVGRVVLAIIAALILALAGLQMITLRSVEGNTIAEFFDNYMGWAMFGFAALALAYGVG